MLVIYGAAVYSSVLKMIENVGSNNCNK